MKIQLAEEKDLREIMKIYEHARRFMAAHGNPRQWGATNWPPETVIRRDIEKQKCYVCVQNSRIAGTFYYDQGERIERTYDQIEGAWRGDGFYGVVHRLASDGTVKGIGSLCINWAFQQCGHIRIDTHVDNIVMQRMLEKNGFIKCGIIHVEQDNDPRIAYEKISGSL